MTTYSRFMFDFAKSDGDYDVSAVLKILIAASPVVVMVLFIVLLMIPMTQPMTLWTLEENKPVEILTFIVALSGGIFGLAYSSKLKNQGEESFVWIFYLLFSLALLFIAMEEIAWGQKFLAFKTPNFWIAINRQGETTLHNVVGLQGHSEFMRLIFGIGGLIGVAVSRSPVYRKIGAPLILLPWFIVITCHSLIDAYNDYFSIEKSFDYFVQRTSELIELLIVTSGCLHIWINANYYSRGPNFRLTMLKRGRIT